MISISDLKVLFDWGLETVEYLKNNRGHSNKDYDIALFAIYDATSETKSYLSSLGKRKKHAQKKEQELSKLWNKAGIKLRQINPDLAQKCIIKGDYWANPKEWTIGDLNSSKFTLKEIIQESRKLLAEEI